MALSSCASHLAIRTEVQPSFNPARYGRVAVLAASSYKPERALAEEIYLAFREMGMQAVGPDEAQKLFQRATPGKPKKFGHLGQKRAGEVARLLHADAVALVSLDYRSGVMHILMDFFETDTGETVAASQGEYEAGFLEALQPHQLAVAITEDIKRKILSGSR